MAEHADLSSYESRYGPLDQFRRQARKNRLAPGAPRFPGLLVEGVDYSGKTTICSIVEEALRSQGLVTTRQACFLWDHPIITRLLALAKTSDDLAFRDTCYTASLLLDLSLSNPPAPGTFPIQERHVLTQIGRNTFFYNDDENWHIESMRQMRPRFSYQVYLTSNVDAKCARTRSRPPKSPRDALLAADPGLHQYFDDAMRLSLPPDEDWLTVDTSTLTPDQVAQVILEHIRAHERPQSDKSDHGIRPETHPVRQTETGSVRVL